MSNKYKIYGYVRVSSTDQNEERQMVALAEAGVPAVSYTHLTLPTRS